MYKNLGKEEQKKRSIQVNGSNELCFLATIFMKPDNIKQIVIPMECIENKLYRFVLQHLVINKVVL